MKNTWPCCGEWHTVDDHERTIIEAELRASLAEKVRALSKDAMAYTKERAGFEDGLREAAALIEGSDDRRSEATDPASPAVDPRIAEARPLDLEGIRADILQASTGGPDFTVASWHEASPVAATEPRSEPVAKFVANLRQQVAIGADTQTREAVVHMLDKIAARLDSSAIEQTGAAE